MPRQIREFKPTVAHPDDAASLPLANIQAALATWVRDVARSAEEAAMKNIRFVTSVAGLVTIRDAVWDTLRTAYVFESTVPWGQIVVDV